MVDRVRKIFYYYLRTMKRKLPPTVAKVLSNLFTDISAAWIISLLGTRDPWLLTGSFVGVMMCLGAAIKLEGIAKND